MAASTSNSACSPFGPGVFGEERTTGSTRKGNVIFLEDVLNRSVEKAREIISANARNDAVKENIDRLSEEVGVGAIIFTEFMQRRLKDVVFTWEKALNMQGESGPYLQYTHARLSSVISKAGIDTTGADLNRLTSRLERNVMLKIGDFPTVITQSVKDNEPSIIAEYLLDLCSEFNRMYADKKNHQIITDDLELSAARVQLVEATRNTLAAVLLFSVCTLRRECNRFTVYRQDIIMTKTESDNSAPHAEKRRGFHPALVIATIAVVLFVLWFCPYTLMNARIVQTEEEASDILIKGKFKAKEQTNTPDGRIRLIPAVAYTDYAFFTLPETP